MHTFQIDHTSSVSHVVNMEYFFQRKHFNVTVLAPLTGCTNEHVKMTDDTKVEIMII